MSDAFLFLFSNEGQTPVDFFGKIHVLLDLEYSGKLEGLTIALESIAPYISGDGKAVTVIVSSEASTPEERVVDVIGFFLNDCRDFYRNVVEISLGNLKQWGDKFSRGGYFAALKYSVEKELNILQQFVNYLPSGLQKRNAQKLLDKAREDINPTITLAREALEKFKQCISRYGNYPEYYDQFKDLMVSVDNSSFRLVELKEMIDDLRRTLNPSTLKRIFYSTKQVIKDAGKRVNDWGILWSLYAILLVILYTYFFLWHSKQGPLDWWKRSNNEEKMERDWRSSED